jgi:hypothetical protein
MKCVFTHNFEHDNRYQLPYVLGYDGTARELGRVRKWCLDNCRNKWTRTIPGQTDDSMVDRRIYRMTFHFIDKQDCIRCKLSNG